MADRGVSEPVARNMLKSATLGIGPLVQEGIADRYLKDVRPSALSIRDRHEKRPPDRDMFLAPAPDFKAAKRQKMREQEALLKAQEEARENEIAEEEQMRKDRQKQKASRSVPGIAKLGPVLAREEEIDPLPPKPDRASDPFDPEEELPLPPPEPEPRSVQILANKKPGGHPDESRRKPKKKNRRRRRGPDDSDSSAPDRGGRSRSRGRAGGSAGGARGRSPSNSRDKNANGLMSEAEVRRRIGLEKKSGRGSERAKQRIQKEQEAWEEAKKNNKEYWRPPKHCLCFAPETARKRLSG